MGIGFLANLQNTIYIERSPSKIKAQLKMLARELDDEKRLIVFPEGTTGDGRGVMPFKSSLFSVLEETQRDVTIQPVTLVFTNYKNKPMSEDIRSLYTWSSLEEIIPALCLDHAEVKVVFGEPVKAHDFDSRKAIALYTQEVVQEQLESALVDANS